MRPSNSITSPSTIARVSTAADPSAPSFLNLPAEIRNHIYVILFSQEDELQIAEVADGSIALVQRSQADDAAELKYYEALQRYRHNGRDSHPALPRPDSVHQGGIHLLRTCGQIHREAAPMLYANTFLIHATRGEYHDRTGQRFDSVLSAWLQQIGQHYRLLKKLILDLGTIGPWDCACGDPERPETFRKDDDYFRCGALLNAIWSMDRGIVVSFVDSGPIPSVCTRPTFDQIGAQQSCCNLEALNRLVQQLAQDELGMKKFRRAIGEIGLHRGGAHGVFIFRTTDWEARQQQVHTETWYNPFFQDAKFFGITEDGTLRFYDNRDDESYPRTVLGFPLKVFDKILAYTLNSVTSYEIDLDSFRDFTDLCGILCIDGWLHHEHFGNFQLNQTFSITMIADNNAILNFDKLRRLLNVRIGCHFCLYCSKSHEYNRFGLDAHYSINLHIHLGTCVSASSPAGPRINVMPLIVATFEANPNRHIKIYTHNANGEVKCDTISIQTLRRSVVPVLRDYVRVLHARDAGILCPELWMDSQGRIEVVSTGSRPLAPEKDPAKEFGLLWSAWKTGYVGAKAPPVPEIGGLARNMYLYLKWITV